MNQIYSFILSINELKAALLFASRDESRWVLNGVHVKLARDKRPVLCATDGRRAVVIESDCGQEDPKWPDGVKRCELTLQRKWLERVINYASACASGTKSPANRLLKFTYTHGEDVRKTSLTVETLDMGIISPPYRSCICEGHFPKLRHVIPKTKPADNPAMAFRGTYLNDYLKAAALLGQKTPNMIAGQTDSLGVIQFHFEGVKNLYGLLMPVRDDSGAVENSPHYEWLPGWLQASEVMAEETESKPA